MFNFRSIGFLNPCFLGIKLLVQDLWRINLDNSLPSDLQKTSKYIQENFSYIYKIEVPWFYGFNSLKDRTELHLFSNSSSHAFGCIVYFWNITDKNLINVSFVIGKSKSLSIPKLKLQGAVTAGHTKIKLIKRLN